MTTIGFRLARTIRSAGRVVTILPRQILTPECVFVPPCFSCFVPPSSSPSSPSSSASPFSTTASASKDPEIESLEDLENLLNVPTYGNRGEEFNKALQLEYDFFKYNGQMVPENMTQELWEQIRTLRTVEDRLELYRFLRLKERHKSRNNKASRGAYAELRRRALLAEKLGGEEKVPEDIYDENGYSMLGPTVSVCRKVDDQVVKKYHNYNLPFALNFGQPLVFDMGVDYVMSNFEGSDFISQMKEMYGSNRAHDEPFNLFLCNYNPRNIVQRKLIEGNHTEKWLWNVTRRCFTDVFPKEKIVYLTSRSRNPLTKFHHDMVYVIGATVDKRPGKDEMSRIKELGLNHAYFDVGPYFTRKAPNNIPLNQIFRALMDHRDTPNLHWAYRHFTRRRFTYRELAMNRIVNEEEHIFVNKRSILAPQTHDLTKYDMQPPSKRDQFLESGADFENDVDYETMSRSNEYDDQKVRDGNRRHHSNRRIPHRYRNLDDEEERRRPSFEELTKTKRNSVTDY